MAVRGNNSSDAQVKEFKLYTGITNVKIIAINPTLDEAKALKLPIREEPKYVEEDGKIRLDFHVEREGSKAKIAIFLENKERLNKDGDKCEYINNSGQTCWSTLTNAVFPDWYDATSVRKAIVGESTLISLLINWLNIKPGDDCYLDNIKALFSENLSELKTLFNSYKDNEFRVMYMVGEGKYQRIYTGYFDRATNKSFTYWKSHFDKQAKGGYTPKDVYSYEFKEFIGVPSDEDAKPKETKSDVF